MIDYFTHFIYIQFHLFRRNDAAAENHRADFADKRTDFLRIHSRLLRNPAERAFIVRHFLYIHLNLSSQFFRKVDKLLMDQVCMIFLLIIQSPYQFGKLKGFVFRFADNRYYTLPSPCRKYHKQQYGNHRQIQRPAKRLPGKKVTERRLLRFRRLFDISFGTDNRKLAHLR